MYNSSEFRAVYMHSRPLSFVWRRCESANIFGGSGVCCGAVSMIRCGLVAVVAAAALTAVAVVGAAAKKYQPAVALVPHGKFARWRKAWPAEFPFMALVANMWGECSAAILSPMAVLGPSSCLPEGYLKNGRVEAGKPRFFTMQDFGEEPSQGRIIETFIKLKAEKPNNDSLMIMKLLEPFYFTHYVQAIPIATEESTLPVRALVVGYGMGSEDWERREQRAMLMLLDQCSPQSADALCIAGPGGNCRTDHGAAVVVGAELLAIAGRQPLCVGSGSVLLVAPHRAWIKQQLGETDDGEGQLVPQGRRRQGKAGRSYARAPAAALGRALCTHWLAAALLALLARALS